MKHWFWLGAFIACAFHPARADVKLATIFSEHAVLQRDRPLPIWGTADAGERVNVKFGAQSGAATADEDGRWQVVLSPQAMSKAPLTMTVTGKNTLVVNDLLLGDVWMCSGQSNMEFALGAADVPADIASANLPMIRQIRVQANFADRPTRDLKGVWYPCSPQSAPAFSAVGFYFARKIATETGVPIGLITNAVGGTNIELWMAQDTLLNTPELAPYAVPMRASLAQYNRDLAATLPTVEAWAAQSRAALAQNEMVPMPPVMPLFPFGEKVMRPRAVTLHNGLIAPLAPLAMRGVLWYQGENNADGDLYVEKNRAMLADWRRWFGDPNLPFYFVQLANWQQPNDDPAGGGWGFIRDAQRRVLAIPGTGMASAIDVGDADNLHPKNKADVGERLALWALRDVYGQKNLVVSGPLLRDYKIEGAKIRLFFDDVGGGLMVAHKDGRAPAVETVGAPLKRFAIASADKKWVWANAVIDGETVVVSAPEVPNPVAVRYAFSTNPAGANLYNRAGLPASPFRTDNW